MIYAVGNECNLGGGSPNSLMTRIGRTVAGNFGAPSPLVYSPFYYLDSYGGSSFGTVGFGNRPSPKLKLLWENRP